MPKVTVIIPTYNCAPYIEETLESVFAQTYLDYEVIVVDNSLDGTSDILRRYGDRIRLFTQMNQGVSPARNFGMEQAKGMYIAFLDGDDVWEPELLKTQVETLDQCPEAVLAFTNLRKMVPAVAEHHEWAAVRLQEPFRKWVESNRTRNPWVSCGDLYRLLLSGNVIPTSSVVLRRAEALEVGNFDGQLTILGEDYDYWLRLSLGFPMAYVDKVLVSYRVRETGLSGPFETQTLRSIVSNLRVLDKHVQEAGAQLSRSDRLLIQRRSATLLYHLGTIHLKKGEGRVAIREISRALQNLKTVGLEFGDRRSSWVKRSWLLLKPYVVWVLSGFSALFAITKTRGLRD